MEHFIISGHAPKLSIEQYIELADTLGIDLVENNTRNIIQLVLNSFLDLPKETHNPINKAVVLFADSDTALQRNVMIIRKNFGTFKKAGSPVTTSNKIYQVVKDIN